MDRIKIKIITVVILLCLCTVCLARYEVIESSQGMNGKTKKTVEDITDEPEKLYAHSAVLMDAESGRVLFGKDEETKRPMASTTKIMTCIVALENMSEGQIVTVSDYAARQPKVHLGASAGLKFYLIDILYSLMLESHNDSAVMVAEGIAGSTEAFVRMMNEKAEKLGLTHTHFVTPNGLDGEDEYGIHATTAKELAKMMKYCIADSPAKEKFLEITGTKEHYFQDVEGKRGYTCLNHNAFLTMMDGAISGKTGFTADAGYCYVGALRRDDRTFIVSLLACGWPNHKDYKWADTKKLMEYGLAHYSYQNVWRDIPFQELVVKNSGDEQNIYRRDSIAKIRVVGQPEELQVLKKKSEQVKQIVRIEKVLTAPVKKNQKVGEIQYILGENVIARYDVRTQGRLQRRTFSWCLKQIAKRLCFYRKFDVIFLD